MKMRFICTFIVGLITLTGLMGLAACGSSAATDATPSEAVSSDTPPSESSRLTGTLIVYSPNPLEFIDPIVRRFESRSGVNVQVVTSPTGELVERIVSEKDDPFADVFWGGSISTMGSYLDLFQPYISASEDFVQEDFKDTDGLITRFTDIPSVIMVNTDLIGDIEVKGYEDLLNPALKGKIALCDPSKSSSTYEHLINMLYAMGNGTPDEGWDYVSKLCENLDGKLLNGSSDVYSGVAAGDYAVGLTFEEGAANYLSEGAPIEIVYMEEGVISNPDGVYILKGAKNPENAKAFVDFVTDKEVQTIITKSLNRRSVRTDVPEPSFLIPKKDINIIHDDPAVVIARREEWLAKFAEVFAAVQQ